MLGTVNFITDDLRRAAAGLVRRGASFSLSQRFDMDGPQRGWRRRTNPVHTMLDTGTDAAAGNQGFPHGIGDEVELTVEGIGTVRNRVVAGLRLPPVREARNRSVPRVRKRG